MIKHKARKEFTVSNLYSKIKIMKKKTIAIIQCILYLIAPYIALQLCSINRSLVTDNLFFIFLILLTISFCFSILNIEKALANDSQQYNSKDLDPFYAKTGNFCTFPYTIDKPLIRLSLRSNVQNHPLLNPMQALKP